ncbi:MAG TPA: FAD-linked oxidase C-terminal domain-containing protein, partial [Acidimicrobiales bacterium]|nr:FAD-linked oxidase C-terminal domain-containing protein [Acidimicrobiales bacterium]
ELAQWAMVKAAAADAVLAAGGTITHHHAVGRDHRPWYDRQRPALFAQALEAAKRALDPKGILNPSVLVDTRGPKPGAPGRLGGRSVGTGPPDRPAPEGT